MEIPAINIILIIYLSVSWLVFLGGVASSQDQCTKEAFQNSSFATAYFGSSGSCSTVYGFPWWICFYQLFIICLWVFFTLRDILASQKLALISCAAPLTALMMQSANNFIKLSTETNASQQKTAAAGAVMLSIGDLVLGYIIGIAEEGIILPKEFNPQRGSSA